MNRQRVKLVVRGAVQGVGFRPFVFRLASKLELTGWVSNSVDGVLIEAEGPKKTLDEFVQRVGTEKPSLSAIHSLESSFVDPAGYKVFEIRESNGDGAKRAVILPDLATCRECLSEIFNPNDRRFLYPFTNCTNCGPRFSIIESLPYDRPHTSMKHFTMCSECTAEYHNPHHRRFHAQPNACPQCGPHLELWDSSGSVLCAREAALFAAASAVRQGGILALKGLGGFQLIVDARNDNAVRRLRRRKHREEKPFAVLFPSLDEIQAACRVAPIEERLLQSSAAPIVLLERTPPNGGLQFSIAPSVAPGNPYLGAMVPYTPLHHLLLRQLGFPIVATSGNLSEEPICIDEREALERLHEIADLFLVHDRPIVRHVDDSVVRVVLGRALVLRRARGYAPLPVHLPESIPSVLAVGAHLKNTVAVSVDNDIFISQHIGDLGTSQAHSAFRKATTDLPRLYDVTPSVVVCDQHPDYASTKYAQELSTPLISAQHHYAHVLACMAENELNGPVLGISWDGTGYGSDGSIWGGEFLLVHEQGFERVANLRQFHLPGGEIAIKEPRRSALGILFEIFGQDVFRRRDLAPVADYSDSELSLLQQALTKGVNAPLTSSAGRLFDAVTALIGLRQCTSFEGQAAMELEFAIQRGVESCYPLDTRGSVNWQPMILAILEQSEPPGIVAAKVHNTLAEAIVAVAQRVGEKSVVLSGGCFQNKYLAERAVRRLQEEGFQAYWHQRIPPNDGGIALGQIMAAARELHHRAESNPKVEPIGMCVAER